MGCMYSTVAPDGNGVDTLPWLATQAQNRLAHQPVDPDIIRAPRLEQRYCRIMVNDQAIWGKILGQASELPFPADDDVKQSAHHVGESACRILVNQEAIWRKLCGECVDSLPYINNDDHKRWANKYHGAQQVRQQCGWELVANQEAIWSRLSDQHIDSLPHPANSDVRDFAGYTKSSKVLLCRMWVNQDAIFNRLLRV